MIARVPFKDCECPDCLVAKADAEFIRQEIALPLRHPGTYEERVIDKIRARREKGLAKYGVGVERDDLTPKEWLQHAQEEAMDLAIYLERLIETA